jgi:hypothetical protein
VLSHSAIAVQSTDVTDCWNSPQELTAILSGYSVSGNCRVNIVLCRLQKLTAVLSGYLVTGNCRVNIVLYRLQVLTAVLSGYLVTGNCRVEYCSVSPAGVNCSTVRLFGFRKL